MREPSGDNRPDHEPPGSPELVPGSATGGSGTAGIPIRGGRPAFCHAFQKRGLVDPHFGHAQAFHGYEYREGQVRFIERREIPQYCLGPSNCGGRENRFTAIAEALRDCSCVLAMRIGNAHSAVMLAFGHDPRAFEHLRQGRILYGDTFPLLKEFARMRGICAVVEGAFFKRYYPAS